jgi:hypothetical protein
MEYGVISGEMVDWGEGGTYPGDCMPWWSALTVLTEGSSYDRNAELLLCLTAPLELTLLNRRNARRAVSG